MTLPASSVSSARALLRPEAAWSASVSTRRVASRLLAAPAAAAQDLRSPDTRDAAAAQVQDLRSPDTRDAAITSSGLELHPMNPPTISTYTSADKPISAPLDVGGGSTDWTTIGLGAGGFALAVLLVGLAAAVRGRRRVAV
jgi:hypothetical protein